MNMPDTIVDIRNFLKYTPSDPEYLQVCNGLISSVNVIDIKEIIYFMREENKSFCRENDLCEVCHSKLREDLKCPKYC